MIYHPPKGESRLSHHYPLSLNKLSSINYFSRGQNILVSLLVFCCCTRFIGFWLNLWTRTSDRKSGVWLQPYHWTRVRYLTFLAFRLVLGRVGLWWSYGEDCMYSTTQHLVQHLWLLRKFYSPPFLVSNIRPFQQSFFLLKITSNFSISSQYNILDLV